MAYNTPGVYIEEISTFPPSVAEVETAIPAFIGYTEIALDSNLNDLTNKPTKISSLVEFNLYFGGAFLPSSYTVTLDSNNVLTAISFEKFYLYDSLQAFFDNGGGVCYIVSVGNYTDDIEYFDNSNPASPVGLKAGLNALSKFDEPTLILFPDAVGTLSNGTNALSVIQLGSLQSDTLVQCNKLQDRFGIFDILGADTDGETPIDNFRTSIGTDNLKYGAAYYPWLSTIYVHNFMLRNVIAAPSTPITDVALPPNPALDAFLTNYKTMRSQTNMVIGKITGLGFNDFNSLTDYYNNLETSLKAIPTTQPANVTTAFRTILTFLRNIVLSFDGIEKDPGAGTDLLGQIASFKLDTELLDQLINYISFEKNSSVLSELSDLANETDVDTAYANYTTNNGWLAGTIVYTDVTSIPALSAGTLNLTLLANTKAKALAALSYIDNNIELSKLLAATEKLFNIAMQNESMAESLLISNYPFFTGVSNALQKELSLLPPSGFMAGVYANVDSTRGVWKSPANVSLKSVVATSVKVNDADQAGLNVDTTGKSINVIRSFAGKGMLVWGARTLAGNDNEWRYINVRRFFIMVEESVKKSTFQFVFESNDANTWSKVQGMIENFLILQWRQGALVGAKPEDAFFVNVGLGKTMTSLDILEGRMNVEIGMAVVRPAEFIILKFSHIMLS